MAPVARLPDHYLSLFNGQYEAAIKYWRRIARKDVFFHYREQIQAGDFRLAQIRALITQTTLKFLQREAEIVETLSVHTLRQADKGAQWAKLGFETVSEWLDASGIDVQSGRGSQYLFIAQAIIPWLIHHQVISQSAEVTEQWFLRDIDGKSIIARMRNAVKRFRDLMTSDLPLETQIAEARYWLGLIADPANSHEVLRQTFAQGYMAQEKIQVVITHLPGDRYRLEATLEKSQLDYLSTVLADVIQIKDHYHPDTMIDI
jgi:hypothetical protein